ncbi:MAG: succinate dehydrogenase, hydrophobic membrane anchor protein [Pseudomonadota bacterium]|nr:succinate dehydrogenase, hydrophobic membrane anchor protein [Pseudomonadota bacterium]
MAIKSVTSLTRTGTGDWIAQRLSAIILALYSVFIVGYLIGNNPSFEQWTALFDCGWMKLATLAAIAAFGAHAWVGLWTVFSDYVNERQMGKSAALFRGLLQVGSALVILGTIGWTVLILWG